MKKIKRVIWAVLRALRIAAPIQLLIYSSLTQNGWFKSYYKKQAVDAGGNPIPWITYPVISFLEERLRKDMRVFEYGSGNSTLWFASRVNSIISVEHDKEWADYVKKTIPGNAQLMYRELSYGGDYGKTVLEQQDPFHIIIVDGRDRIFCAKNAAQKLTDDGIIIFDNSDRDDYREAYDFLKEKGFHKLPFRGFSPVTPHTNETGIFYRKNNCLGI